MRRVAWILVGVVILISAIVFSPQLPASRQSSSGPVPVQRELPDTARRGALVDVHLRTDAGRDRMLVSDLPEPPLTVVNGTARNKTLSGSNPLVYKVHIPLNFTGEASFHGTYRRGGGRNVIGGDSSMTVMEESYWSHAAYELVSKALGQRWLPSSLSIDERRVTGPVVALDAQWQQGRTQFSLRGKADTRPEIHRIVSMNINVTLQPGASPSSIMSERFRDANRCSSGIRYTNTTVCLMQNTSVIAVFKQR